MLIEVCGVDGSGKSTLIDGVRRKLRSEASMYAYERVVRSESRNLLEAVCAEEGFRVFGDRDQELAVLLDALDQAGHLSQYRGSRFSHALVVGYQCALAARLDERRMSADRGLQNLAARLPAPDALLLLEVPAEVAIERIKTRTKGDGLLDSADPIAAILARQDALIAHGARLGAKFLNATAPPAELVDAVVEFVKNMEPCAQ